jgi:hypothetical protein
MDGREPVDVDAPGAEQHEPRPAARELVPTGAADTAETIVLELSEEREADELLERRLVIESQGVHPAILSPASIEG